MRRLLAIALTLAILLPLLATPAAAEEERFFPETGKRVAGEFLAFYDANGGPDLFGPPITDAFSEGGRTVQYFSRVRFELWPENPPAHRVLLGLLAAQMGKVQPPIQADVPAGDPVRRYFPETGHVVAFGFKEFWEKHGGVGIFGYPTTEQLVENGRIVQYFQRVRMEWHPENAPGSTVVLGDLGSEYLQGGGAPVPTSTAAPQAAGDRLLFHVAPGGDIYSVRPDGSDLQRIGQGMDPAWSPDRTRIAFARWYPPAIYVAVADGGDPRPLQLTSYPWETPNPQAPAWSADGRFIAFYEKYRDFRPVRTIIYGVPTVVQVKMDLWRVDVVDVQSGQVHIVTEDDYGASPSWGPDGRLVFASTQGLFIVNDVAGKREITKVPNTDPRFSSPAWSPDGQWIAFQWRQHDHWEVGIIRPDGSGFQLLTSSPLFTTPAHNVAPTWSPDGKSIAFLSNRNQAWQIFVMDASGANQRALDLGGLPLAYDFVMERPVRWGN
mgnify:CR=1 FL=1